MCAITMHIYLFLPENGDKLEFLHYLCTVKKVLLYNINRCMKKLVSVLIVLMVAVLMTLTRPSKEQHKEAMMKAVEEYVDEEAKDRLGDNVLAKISRGVVVKTAETALNSKLKENNYYRLQYHLRPSQRQGQHPLRGALRLGLYLRQGHDPREARGGAADEGGCQD